MAQGGRRPGAGRPKGSRDSRPRIRRADVLNARREAWDAWEKKTDALRKIREVLLEIVLDPDVPARDRIKAAQLIEERGLGRPTEEHEQPVAQPLLIMLPGPDGGYRKLEALPEANVIEGEFHEPEAGLGVNQTIYLEPDGDA